MQKKNTEALKKSIPLNLTHHYARTGKVLTTTVATPRTGQRKLASTFYQVHSILYYITR